MSSIVSASKFLEKHVGGKWTNTGVAPRPSLSDAEWRSFQAGVVANPMAHITGFHMHAQPLALATEMQRLLEEKYGITCKLDLEGETHARLEIDTANYLKLKDDSAFNRDTTSRVRSAWNRPFNATTIMEMAQEALKPAKATDAAAEKPYSFADELQKEFGGTWTSAAESGEYYSATFDTEYGEKLGFWLKKNNVSHTLAADGQSLQIVLPATSKIFMLAAIMCDKFRKPENKDRTVEGLLNGTARELAIGTQRSV